MTNSEYTPTEMVRTGFAFWVDQYGDDRSGAESFDRWLAAHDAEVFAAGKREGAAEASRVLMSTPVTFTASKINGRVDEL